MNEPERSLIKVNPGLLAALHKGNLQLNVFAKELLVLKTLVAGTSFRNLKNIEPELQPGSRLELKREKGNKHDEFAVALIFGEKKIGYIPREQNEVIARLMEAGKNFFAKVTKKAWEGNWLKVKIEVFMQD